MTSLSEKIRANEREQLIEYIDEHLYALRTTGADCHVCFEEELEKLRDRLIRMNGDNK